MIFLRSALNFRGIPEVPYAALSDNEVLCNVWTTSLVDYIGPISKSHKYNLSQKA